MRASRSAVGRSLRATAAGYENFKNRGLSWRVEGSTKRTETRSRLTKKFNHLHADQRQHTGGGRTCIAQECDRIVTQTTCIRERDWAEAPVSNHGSKKEIVALWPAAV